MSPQRAHYSAESTGERIKKSPRWDDEGVAATVGTIMALLVFLTFFGMFTNQFVPVWMSDNESSHMAQVTQQFASLKSQIDISISNSANSLVAPAPIFVPITLSSDGIPVFAAGTAGILSFMPIGSLMIPWFNVTYTYKSETTSQNLVLGPANDGKSGGNLDLYCPNRYFVEQHLAYENGAVIVNQTDGEFVVAGPQFLVRNLGTTANPMRVVMMTQVSMYGSNVTIGGTGSKGVNAELQYAGTTPYTNDDGAQLTIQIFTKHGWAWYDYFMNALNGTADMTKGKGFNISEPLLHSFDLKSRNYYSLTITINDVTILDHTRATVKMSIGELGL